MTDKRLAPKTVAWLALAVTLLAGGLRLWQLDRPALWEDDYLNLDRALMPLGKMTALQLRQGPGDTPSDFQPPLSFALEHLALSFSPRPWAARLVSVAAGTFAVWGVFALGRNLFGAGPGLLAALLLTFSLFHLDYSRAIKAYGLFFCLSAWSSVFLTRAMRTGRARDFAAYALTATGMLYSAYIGLPAFMGQAVWAGALAGLGLLGREPDAKAKALGLAASAGAAGLAYLPWLPAVFYLRQMFYDPTVDPLSRFTPEFWRSLLGDYFLAGIQPPVWFAPSAAALILAGVVWSLASSQGRRGLAFLLLWGGAPSLAVMFSHSIMNAIVSARHLFNLLGPLVLLCAAGAFAAGLAPRRGARVALAVGAALVLGLCWPAARALPEFYARALCHDREYFYWLATQADRADALLFAGYQFRTKAFGARYELPGLLNPPGDFDAPAYRRLLVSQSAQKIDRLEDLGIGAGQAQTLDDHTFGAFRTRTRLAGLVPDSPIVVWPGPEGHFSYRADFGSLGVLADMAQARNVAPYTDLDCLGPYRASQPARALFRFVIPKGADLSRVMLDAGAALYKRHPASVSDAALTLSAGPDPQSLRPVAVIGQSAFADATGKAALESCTACGEQAMYATCARTEKSLDLTGLAGRELWVEARFTPGEVEGLLLLSSLRLAAKGEWREAPAESLAALRLRAAVENSPVLPWRPGAFLAGPGLFAFALPGGGLSAKAPVGDALELSRFQVEHPGLAPVAVLPDDQGRPAVAFYDPEPELDAAHPGAFAEGARENEARSITLRGKLDVPSLLIGEERVDIPVSFPRGSTLVLNSGGEGRLHWSPVFARDQWDRLDFTFEHNTRPTPDKDYDGGLTCAGNGEEGCVFDYAFVSAFPVREINLEWLPRVSAGPQGREAATVSLRVEDGPFKTLERFAPTSPSGWSGSFVRHDKRVVFDKPVHHLTLRFELTGEGAQVWAHSRPVDRMWLEAKLDARSLPALRLPGGGFPLALAEPRANAFTVRFSGQPRPFFDSLKDWR